MYDPAWDELVRQAEAYASDMEAGKNGATTSRGAAHALRMLVTHSKTIVAHSRQLEVALKDVPHKVGTTAGLIGAFIGAVLVSLIERLMI